MNEQAWRWLLFSLVLAAPISTSQAAGPPPKLPACISHVIKIDSSRLESLRREYERSKGQGASEEDFMFAWLTAQIFSRILFGDFNLKDLPSDFGLLYWSGLNGGVWLNQIVHFPKGLCMITRLFKRPMLLCGANKTRSRLRLIESGSASEKQEAARKAIKFLALIYGYNRGYLLEILKHPPAGANTTENILVCGEFLECQYGGGDQAVLAPLLLVRAKLANPPSSEWETIAATIKNKLPGSITCGGWVWRRIMSGREFSADSYKTLLDISRGFLMANEAVMLAVCQSFAEKDEPQLGRALAADAALRIGLGGYVIGLGGKNPAQ